jgi:hypothetical protein
MQIVVAWTEETQEVVKVGRVDIGDSHKFKTVQLPRACMWLNKGTEADAEKAREYAASEGHSVFCYEGEKDPLGRAKKDVLNKSIRQETTK